MSPEFDALTIAVSYVVALWLAIAPVGAAGLAGLQECMPLARRWLPKIAGQSLDSDWAKRVAWRSFPRSVLTFVLVGFLSQAYPGLSQSLTAPPAWPSFRHLLVVMVVEVGVLGVGVAVSAARSISRST